MCLYRKIFEDDQHGFEQYRPYIVRHISSIESSVLVEFIFMGFLTRYGSSIMYALIQLNNHSIRFHGQNYPITVTYIADIDGSILYSIDKSTAVEPSVHQLRFAPEMKKEVTLRFESPLRVKNEGHLMSQFSWKPFFRSLYYRTSYIDKYFNDSMLALPDLWGDEPGIEENMGWQEMYRRSSRQKQAMLLGGLIGRVRVMRPSPETVALLKIGEVLQSGKQTTFGLGKYVIEYKASMEVT